MFSTPTSSAPVPLAIRLRGLLMYLDITTPRATYVMRSLMAAWLALTVAYLLELQAPYSAASSVLLVINPIHGAVMGKGTWRVLGTLAGILVAILLMSAFGQMPLLFLLGFGFWLGLCVAGMTLLRHFRASGTVVAGYTVGLAIYGALDHPLMTFEQVTGRGSSVMVGVLCLTLVSALFSPRNVRASLEARLNRLASSTAGALTMQFQSAAVWHPARRKLMAEIYSVDDLLALGKAESADLALRAVAVRHTMTSLFAALVSGVPPIAQHSARQEALRTLQPEIEQAWREAGQALASEPHGIKEAIRILKQARTSLDTRLVSASCPLSEAQAAWLITGERLSEQIEDYIMALEGMAALQHSRPHRTPRTVHFHRDLTTAGINGIRAMLTLVLGGVFWIVTGWPHGNLMLAALAASCALLATAPNPAAGSVEFIKGTVLAVPAAFLCTFVVLPHIDGLPLLLIVLGLFWLPGVCATSSPRFGLAGLAYLVGFTTLAAPGNPVHYDPVNFLNASGAWIVAMFFTLLSFRVLLPRNPANDIRRLRYRIRDETLALLNGAATPRHRWQMRQQHRLAQLGTLLRNQPDAMDRAIDEALISLHLGREWLRLRDWLRQAPPGSPVRATVAAALQRAAYRVDDPLRASRHLRHAARRLAQLQSPSRTTEQQRLIAVLIDVAQLLAEHAHYFSTLPRKPVHVQ